MCVKGSLCSGVTCVLSRVVANCFCFSSRRRHTRFDCDWSSDVCSSDLGNLAGAELGLIAAVAAAQAANLSFVIRPLRRVAARLVDEAVPDVDIHDSRLLGSAAVELVEIGRIGARLGTALRRQTHPHDRNACALEGGNGRIDAPDIGELPLLRVKLPRSIGCLARLLRRHIGVFGGLGGGGRLLLRVGRRGRNRRGRERGGWGGGPPVRPRILPWRGGGAPPHGGPFAGPLSPRV